MKRTIALAASLCALNLTTVFGQSPGSDTFQDRLRQLTQSANPSSAQAPTLTKFNLDFPGGPPAELVAAIEKAAGKPLNAIIPTEDADQQLPPLKMSGVDVVQLFAALEVASQKEVSDFRPGFGPQSTTISFGFRTADRQASDSSIWYFFVDKPSSDSPQKVCEFFSLAPYLDRGFTVDDITTAIQTGWKMSGINPPPDLNYHKETKMLIAYGVPNQLETIREVLNTLPSTNATKTELDNLNGAIINVQKQNADLQDQVKTLKVKVLEITGPK